MSSRAVGNAAPGADAESVKQMPTLREAAGETRPAADLTQERKAVMVRDLAPGTAPAIGAAVGRQMRMWMTALDAYKVALLQMGRKMGMLRKIEAESAPSVDAEMARTVAMRREMEAEGAPGMDTALEREMVMERIFDGEAAAGTASALEKHMALERSHDAETAPGRDTDAQRRMVSAVLVSGATWGDPVMLDGGVLYIRQAYAAIQNGNTLEVS